MKEQIIEVKDYVTKSNLPASDFVINPYVGCPHGCKYCYACFMKRFTKHDEEWGTFIDIKNCTKPISKKDWKAKPFSFPPLRIAIIIMRKHIVLLKAY